MKDTHETHRLHDDLTVDEVRNHDNALYETIEFSSDDLKRLRRPNRQPIDSDYFMRGSGYDDFEMEEDNFPTYKELEAKEIPQPHTTHPRQPKDTKPVTYYDIETVGDLADYNQFGTAPTADEPTPNEKNSLWNRFFSKSVTKEPELSEDAVLSQTPVTEANDQVSLNSLDEAESYKYDAVAVNEEIVVASEIGEAVKTEVNSPQIEEVVEREEDTSEVCLSETDTSLTASDEKFAETYVEQEQSEENPDVFPTLEDVALSEVAPVESDDYQLAHNEEQILSELPSANQQVDLQETISLNLKEGLASIKQFGNRLQQSMHGIGMRERSDKVAQLPQEEIDAYSEALSQATATYHEPILTDQVLETYLGTDDLQAKHQLDDQLAEARNVDTSNLDATTQTDQATIVKGTAWLSFGSIFSRILGAIYVIPWAAWLGKEYTGANALYSIGYKPYALFLAIATAGFPSAIAKQMAFYHSKKEYKMAHQLFKNAMLIMTIAGVVAAVIMYLLAPLMASQSPTDNQQAAILVIRTLVPALLILPPMSLLRGYFQGFDDMAPMAISQVLEQIIRVIYMLVATYVIMRLYNGGVTEAVAHSTFAAFLGALASLCYLVLLYVRRYPLIKRLIEEASANQIEMDFKTSMKLLVIDSIPFIILGAGITIAQNIDTYSFSQILTRTSTLTQTEISQLYGAMSMDTDKLIMIIISLATALSTALIPTITRLYAAGNQGKTGQLISHILVLFSIVMLPAAIGMAGIAEQVYALFYAANGHPQGPELLVTSAYMSIALGAFMVISTILQSMSYRRISVRLLLFGLLAKLLLQIPLVALWQAHGALLATAIAFALTTGLMWMQITRAVTINQTQLIQQLAKIIGSAIIMGVVVSLWMRVLVSLVGPVGRLGTFLEVGVVVVVAVAIYGALLGLSGQLHVLLGDKYQQLQEDMRLF